MLEHNKPFQKQKPNQAASPKRKTITSVDHKRSLFVEPRKRNRDSRRAETETRKGKSSFQFPHHAFAMFFFRGSTSSRGKIGTALEESTFSGNIQICFVLVYSC